MLGFGHGPDKMKKSFVLRNLNAYEESDSREERAARMEEVALICFDMYRRIM